MPTGNDFRSSILRYLCPTKASSLEKFWCRHFMWLVVKASPNQKIWVRQWIGDRLKKTFEDLFFFFGEHLRLCPWSLASSIPVLGLKRVCPRKAVLGPGFFLCPWPRTLCPRFHLCWRGEGGLLFKVGIMVTKHVIAIKRSDEGQK